ncbi:alpha/beta hydrolase [Jatrophihabitans sp.]|uniref:alpha/beta fold hydrolase n=1 Tax=Jatrophihabitans sp. TaxID=1932789 RepID=UPI0030C68C21|nr:Pimeloyl-ACP methyl ester carboxylesterase [Jatrophihabitans sp.]
MAVRSTSAAPTTPPAEQPVAPGEGRPARDARLSDTVLPGPETVTGIWPGRTVNVGGVDVHVRTTPTENKGAEPALLVHGLGGSAHNWTDFAGILRDQLAIEAIDLPGFGRSGPAHDRDYSLRSQARTVIDYLEISGRGPVHLVGNSMGGAISILVAAQRPDLIRTLTLISPAVPDTKFRAHPLRSDPRMALLIVPMVGAAALRRMRGIDVATRVRATIALCFADPSRYPATRLEEAAQEATARLRLPWAEDAMLRATRGLVRTQFAQRRQMWAALRAITAPTLVLWGDEDRLVAPDLAPVVAAALRNSRLLVLEHVGHTAMMEDPLTSARAVLALVEDAAKLS